MARLPTVYVDSSSPARIVNPGRPRGLLFQVYHSSKTVKEGAMFVDLYNGIMPEVATLIGVDGLHPTEAGYRRIAEVFLAAIAANLEE